jgi:hypothetical protein
VSSLSSSGSRPWATWARATSRSAPTAAAYRSPPVARPPATDAWAPISGPGPPTQKPEYRVIVLPLGAWPVGL